MKRLMVFGVMVTMLAGLAAGSGCQINQTTGTRQFNLLTLDDDVTLGKEAKPELQKEYGGPVQDKIVQDYVAGVGKRIALKTAHPELPYEFTVLDSDVVNAFALPGGPVFVTRGLLEKIGSEDELAAVLGHEIAHVNLRHGSAQISRQMGVQIVLEAAGAAAGGSETAAAAGSLAKVVAGLVDLKYSRDQESEADHYGLDYMVNSGYDANGMVKLLTVFVDMEKKGGSPPQFLSTHPNPDNRVGAVEQRIAEKKYDLRGGRVGAEEYKTNVLARFGKG